MGIPRKGSRKVEVGGKTYLYLIKETNIEDHHDQWELTVTVQEDAPKPGRVLQFKEDYGFPVTKGRVAEVIEHALKKGWKPSERGVAVQLRTISPDES
jgi:hypothetical protein